MAVYDAEYRRMAKAANQRLLTFERADINSPAVLRAKAILSISDRRRFSETGKAESQEAIDAWKRDLRRFLYEDKTSTKAGYRKYREEVLATSQERYDYKAAGLSDDEWLDIWEDLPDIKKDRTFSSDVYVAVIEEAKAANEEKRKKNKGKPIPDIDVKKLIKDFEATGDYTEGIEAVGLKKRNVSRRLRQIRGGNR